MNWINSVSLEISPSVSKMPKSTIQITISMILVDIMNVFIGGLLSCDVVDRGKDHGIRLTMTKMIKATVAQKSFEVTARRTAEQASFVFWEKGLGGFGMDAQLEPKWKEVLPVMSKIKCMIGNVMTMRPYMIIAKHTRKYRIVHALSNRSEINSISRSPFAVSFVVLDFIIAHHLSVKLDYAKLFSPKYVFSACAVGRRGAGS